MKKSEQRDFEALNYGQGSKAKLTAKQYLVYSYLMSISKWDAQDREQHYYVYKNSFVINEACRLLNITAPTWRAAIKKLCEHFYIWDKGAYYIIDIPNSYAPLSIYLIKTLVQFGSQLINGGNIVSVYSVLYKYWVFQSDNGQSCEININQLKKLFGGGTHGSQETMSYKIMLAIYKHLGILKTKEVERIYQGNKYIAYIIKDVQLELPNYQLYEDAGPDDINGIVEALSNSIIARGNIA